MSITDYSELIIEASERAGGANFAPRADMLCGMLETYLNKKLRVSDMENSSSVTTDSNGDATMPTGWIDIKGVYYEDVRVPRRMFAPVEIDFIGWGYYTEGDTLKSNLEDADLEIRYYKEIPTLSSNGTNWLLTAEPEIYLTGLAWQGAKQANEFELAAASKDSLDYLIAEFVRHDAQKRRGHTEIDMAGGNYERGNDFTITPIS